MSQDQPWVAWCMEYKDVAHRKWTLFRGLWWTRKEAMKSAREWLQSHGNGGLIAVRVYKVTIPSGDGQAKEIKA